MTFWIVRSGTGHMAQGRINGDTAPCPTIMAGGLGGGNCSQYWLEDDGIIMVIPTQDKPSYRVPSMAEIAALPWNALTVASTFSGCGGSCLGYRMAGYRVLWANEFIPAAQASYRANAPETSLDTRDIRTILPEHILAATGLAVGELDLLDGSPPCASFSTAGKRADGWGKVKAYSETQQRTDDLFFEYVRLVQGLQPKIFVAENVSGLVKGVAKGYFKEILAGLKACGYRVEARLLDAQWLGVPQQRQRIIFMGVRHDLGKAPVFPKPLPYQYSVRDALPWITGDIEGANGFNDHGGQSAGLSMPTVQASRSVGPMSARAYRDNPGAFGHEGDCTDLPAPTVLAESVGTHWIEPETDIARYAIGREWDTLAPGEQSAKYRNLVKPGLDKPCNTVTGPPSGQFSPTAASGSASVVHPLEKRKFTIAELKRICAFPDDFVLVGTYSQQWERLGRAVPPVMMKMVAKSIRDHIFNTL